MHSLSKPVVKAEKFLNLCMSVLLKLNIFLKYEYSCVFKVLLQMTRKRKVFKLLKNSLLLSLVKPPLKIYYFLSTFYYFKFNIFNKNLSNCSRKDIHLTFFKTYLSTIFIMMVQWCLLYFPLKQEYLFYCRQLLKNILLTFMLLLIIRNKQNNFIITKYQGSLKSSEKFIYSLHSMQMSVSSSFIYSQPYH